SRRRHTRFSRDWSSDVCSSDLVVGKGIHRVFLVDGKKNRLPVNRRRGGVHDFSHPRPATRLKQLQGPQNVRLRIEQGILHRGRRSEERRVGTEWRSRGSQERGE